MEESKEPITTYLLLHTEVCWLSKGKVFGRVIYLGTEIISFLETKDTEYEFSLTICIRLRLQDAKENIITISCKLKAFLRRKVGSLDQENLIFERRLDFLHGLNFTSTYFSPIELFCIFQ